MRLTIEKDIYFDHRYGEVSATLEKGLFNEFLFEHTLGVVRHQFIIRPIEKALKGYDSLFDLTTPYGYGGPLILESEEGQEENLVSHFIESFREFCADHCIVSEFVRFHPIAGNAKDFAKHYDTDYYNHTVGTNLVDFDDPFLSEYSRSCRRDVRRALRDGLVFEVEEHPSSLNDFYEIYTHTMSRLGANSYYFFSREYFESLINKMSNNILKGIVKFQDKTIAMGLFFRTEELLHDHLSGSRTEYLHLAPTYILHYGFMKWGLENGIKLIHYGGGTSRSKDDSLLVFKRQFGKNTQFPFFIGRKIWNMELYDLLIEEGDFSDSGHFPAYRTHR